MVPQQPTVASSPLAASIPAQDPQSAFQALLGQSNASLALAPGQSVGVSRSVSSAPSLDRNRIDPALAAAQQAQSEGQKTLAEQDIADAEQQKSDWERVKASQADTQAYGEKLTKPLLDQADALEAQRKEAEKQRLEHNAKMQSAINDMDDMAKNIAANQPHDIWAEQGLGTKIALVALQGLGAGIQQLYNKKTNPVIDQMDAWIQRDLTQQRMRIEADKENFANKSLLVGKMAQYFDHTETAYDAAHATAWEGIKGRLEIMKPLMSNKQQQAKVDELIAQADIKAAMARQRLQTMMVGKAVQQKMGIAGLEAGVAKANQTASAVREGLSLRQAQGEQKAAATAASQEIPGWRFPEGVKGGKPDKVVGDLATSETTAKKVFKAMSGITAELDKVKNPTDLLNSDAYREYKQAEAQLLEAARGPGFGQTGARLTDTLKKLEEAAFTPGALGRLTPQESKKIVKRAQINLLTNLRDAFAEHGAVPYHHEFLGGE